MGLLWLTMHAAQAPSIHSGPLALANLQPVKEFLREQRDLGVFVPALRGGLD